MSAVSNYIEIVFENSHSRTSTFHFRWRRSGAGTPKPRLLAYLWPLRPAAGGRMVSWRSGTTLGSPATTCDQQPQRAQRYKGENDELFRGWEVLNNTGHRPLGRSERRWSRSGGPRSQPRDRYRGGGRWWSWMGAVVTARNASRGSPPCDRRRWTAAGAPFEFLPGCSRDCSADANFACR